MYFKYISQGLWPSTDKHLLKNSSMKTSLDLEIAVTSIVFLKGRLSRRRLFRER